MKVSSFRFYNTVTSHIVHTHSKWKLEPAGPSDSFLGLRVRIKSDTPMPVLDSPQVTFSSPYHTSRMEKDDPTISQKHTLKKPAVLPLEFLGVWHVQLCAWRTRALYGGNRTREDLGAGGCIGLGWRQLVRVKKEDHVIIRR